MLQIHSKSLDFNGASMMNDVVIASMHASHSMNGEMYFSMNIADVEAYAANKILVDADAADFCKAVVDAILATQKDEAVEE